MRWSLVVLLAICFSGIFWRSGFRAFWMLLIFGVAQTLFGVGYSMALGKEWEQLLALRDVSGSGHSIVSGYGTILSATVVGVGALGRYFLKLRESDSKPG